MGRRFPIAEASMGLLVLVFILTGCVGEWSPEEAAARTATVSAYRVPTATPDLSATEPPTPEPAPTEAITPTPASALPQESPVADLPTGIQAGQLPPDFVLGDASGQEVSLSSFRGRPVVIVFWASWCTHCQKEVPLLQTMYEEYGDAGLMVIGVNVPGLGGDTKDKALAFVAEKDITFPILFDEGGQAYQQYQVSGVPNLIFVDRDGVIVSNVSGAMDAELLESQIRQILEEG